MSAGTNPWDKYVGAKKWGWYLDDLTAWQNLFVCSTLIKALEVGAFDGVSANLMLDLLFTHPESSVHTVDPFQPDPTTPEVDEETFSRFLDNRRIGGHVGRIVLYEGLSAEVLAWMTASDGFWQSFDFIYIDGSHLAKDVFIDAALSWNLLKSGGVIAFDDFDWGDWQHEVHRTPRVAIQSFERVFADRLDLLHTGRRRIYRKTEGMTGNECNVRETTTSTPGPPVVHGGAAMLSLSTGTVASHCLGKTNTVTIAASRDDRRLFASV